MSITTLPNAEQSEIIARAPHSCAMCKIANGGFIDNVTLAHLHEEVCSNAAGRWRVSDVGEVLDGLRQGSKKYRPPPARNQFA